MGILGELESRVGVLLDAGVDYGVDVTVDGAMKGLYQTAPSLYIGAARSVRDHEQAVQIALATGAQSLYWLAKVIYSVLPLPFRSQKSESDFGKDFLSNVPRAIIRHFRDNSLVELPEGADTEINMSAITAVLQKVQEVFLHKPRQFIDTAWERTKSKAQEAGISERALLFRAKLADDRERRLDTLYREGDEITRAVIDSRRAGEKFGTELKRRIKESGSR